MHLHDDCPVEPRPLLKGTSRGLGAAYQAGVQADDVFQGEHGAGRPAEAIARRHSKELLLAVLHALLCCLERPAHWNEHAQSL